MEASRGLARPRRAPAKDFRGLLGPQRLARQAAAGDERAFATIFERHHQELYRYCLAILRNPADAEDALQSTMSKALQALPGDGREIQLRPWLFRVAHNESIAILRERRPTRAAAEDLDPAGGVEPEAAAERSERLRTLVADLKQLPDRQRSALVMRELSGLGYSEIAAALDCSEGAARQTLYEARAALQTRAEGRQMECEEARRAISAGDRRRLRGRKLRAHLSDCDGCSDFEAAIAARRRDLAVIAPPLPVASAAGIFAGLAGGSGTSGAGFAAVGGGAGSIAGGVAGTAALKGASVAAALVLAAGVADKTGVIDLPTPFGSGGGRAETTSTAPGSSPGHAHGASGSTHLTGGAHGSAADVGAPAGRTEADGPGRSGRSGQGHGGGGGAAGSNPGDGGGATPGQSGTSPGQVGTAPGLSGSTPGQSGSAPGQSGTAPGQSEIAGPPGQAGTAPGLSGSTPGQSGTAPGQSSKPAVPPGQEPSAATPPGQESAPGQAKHD